MHGTHQPVWTNLRAPQWWRSRAAVVVVVLIGYAILFYAVAHTRPPRPSADGFPMLTPVISQRGLRRGDGLGARPPAIPDEDQSTPPATHWIFPPIDLWPSASGWTAVPSEFTPVTDAQADPRDGPPPVSPAGHRARPSILRMVRWLRPGYPVDWASGGVQGSVVLDVLIDPTGKPVEIKVARGSGFPKLDQSTARAANDWRFAPPRWNSRSVEVWGRIEVRFLAHAGDGDASDTRP